MHLADREGGVLTSAIVGGGIPTAVGEALAAKMRGLPSVSVACFGDGAASIGAFHESAVMARALNLPVIFLLENNRYSVATTLLETAGFEDLAIRAAGYDMPALIVDGMHPIAVLLAMTSAREHAASQGPVLIEARTYRYYHQNGPLPGSAFRYRTKDEEKEWTARDPLTVFPRRLVESGALSADQVDHVAGLARALVQDCVAAITTELPDGTVRISDALYPSVDTVRDGMLGPGLPALRAEILDDRLVDGAEEILYGTAVSRVIGRWLERDKDAFVIGEEVGHLGGGVFGATKAALATFPERVLNSPICENGFVGAAFGAALLGMHPIVELMYPDFALEAADQLLNHIPRARYMYGDQHEVPIVVRTQVSRGRGYGPQHSGDPAGLFALFPGWRIVAPSTATEYIGLFNAAMLSRDPVLVIEDHRLTKLASPLPPAGIDFVIAIGIGRTVRSGTDVTVLAWSQAVGRVEVIANNLAARGISVEVIDPRWLDRASFDRRIVLESVGRTGALVIVEDGIRSASLGSQIIDYLLPDLFPLLRTAPIRVTGEDVYPPVSRPLEASVLLQDDHIEEAILAAVHAARSGNG
jgi:2-oxoisovalerate dehydrogenase E1 component